MTGSAIECVSADIRFATVLRVTVAVSVARRTADAAHAVRTRWRAVRAVARYVAGSAISDARIGVGFAAVGSEAVAVLVGGSARRHRASTADARAHSIRRRALGAAGAAVVCVGFEVHLAAVDRIAVAISKAIIAGTDRTQAQRANGGCVGEYTSNAAAATIQWIIVGVRLATSGEDLVAVPERRLTQGNLAGLFRANRRTTRLINTDVSACTAVIDVIGEVHLATIGNLFVAIVEVAIARDATDPGGTARRAVGAIAQRSAATTVARIGQRIRFAAVCRVVIAVLVTFRTSSHRTNAVGTRSRRVRQAADIAASSTVVQIRGLGGFAPVGWVSVAIRKPATTRRYAPTSRAGCSSVIVGTGLATPTTVGCSVRQIDLATRVRTLVTVTESRSTGNGALSAGTGGRTVDRAALEIAGAAVQYVGIRVGLASIGGVTVAVGITHRAGRVVADSVFADLWLDTCDAALTAVGVAFESVHLAAVLVLLVAVSEVRLAALDPARPIEALYVGAGLVTAGTAGSAVVRVRLKVDAARLWAARPPSRAGSAVQAARDARPKARLAYGSGLTVLVRETPLALVVLYITFERITFRGVAFSQLPAVGIRAAAHMTDLVGAAIETGTTRGDTWKAFDTTSRRCITDLGRGERRTLIVIRAVERVLLTLSPGCDRACPAGAGCRATARTRARTAGTGSCAAQAWPRIGLALNVVIGHAARGGDADHEKRQCNPAPELV